MALSAGNNKSLMRQKPKSTLLQQVLKQVVTLPLERQDSIAIEILDSLKKPDAKSARFQQLIENKYTTGLSEVECSELEGLEADFRKGDEAFYGPILERIERLESSGMVIQPFWDQKPSTIGEINMAELHAARIGYEGVDNQRRKNTVTEKSAGQLIKTKK